MLLSSGTGGWPAKLRRASGAVFGQAAQGAAAGAGGALVVSPGAAPAIFFGLETALARLGGAFHDR